LILVDCEKFSYQGQTFVELLFVVLIMITSFTMAFFIFGYTFLIYIGIAICFLVVSGILYGVNGKI